MTVDQFLIKTQNFSVEEINAIVNIHRDQISQGFLTSLGDKALELIFSLAIVSESGVLLIGVDPNNNHNICGFLLGAINTNRFFKDFILRKSIQAVFFLAPKLLSINNLRKAFEAILYPTKNEIQDLPNAELFDLAVKDEYKGTGLAQNLFTKFIMELKKANVKAVKITSGSSLKRAHAFYEKMGAKKISTIEIHKGEDTLIYVYEIEN